MIKLQQKNNSNSTNMKYSIPLRTMWDRFHEWSKVNPNGIVMQFYHFIWQYAMTLDTVEMQNSLWSQLVLWYKDYKGELLHVWLEQSELYDFLQNKVELKDSSSLKQYLKDNGNSIKERDMHNPSATFDYMQYEMAIHIPYFKEGCTLSFNLISDNTLAVYFSDDDSVGYINETEYLIAKARNDKGALSVERNYRFAINLLTYMICFPECIREGTPSLISETPNPFRGKNIRLGISDKVIEEGSHKGVKRPHMRKGYFKYLGSEFYKNKRGQWIFVSETMVKGKSKTVMMSDYEEKVDEFKYDAIR